MYEVDLGMEYVGLHKQGWTSPHNQARFTTASTSLLATIYIQYLKSGRILTRILLFIPLQYEYNLEYMIISCWRLIRKIGMGSDKACRYSRQWSLFATDAPFFSREYSNYSVQMSLSWATAHWTRLDHRVLWSLRAHVASIIRLITELSA
jgi:hypothetical protein